MARLEIRNSDDKTIATVRVSPGGLIEMDPPNAGWEAELKQLVVVDARIDREGPPDPIKERKLRDAADGDDDRDVVRVTPEDGDVWLFGLQVNYRGIYARGVYIDE
jgi:hypothetical protein